MLFLIQELQIIVNFNWGLYYFEPAIWDRFLNDTLLYYGGNFMKDYTFTSHSSNETMNFASELASKLHPGNVVVLSGELGAGKTKFTEGFLKYFGLDDDWTYTQRRPGTTSRGRYNIKTLYRPNALDDERVWS